MNIMKHTERDTCDKSFNDYKDYKPFLRILFNSSCCYCTQREYENHLGFYHVDHFRPKNFFKSLETNYNNLYYVCHKCNVHKSDNWISTADGCIRNCKTCNNKVCDKNEVGRFIDPCLENPLDYIEENADYTLSAKAEVVAGTYTIEKLRLNRNQLIRLRMARSKLTMWLDEQKQRLDNYKKQLTTAKEQLVTYEGILSRQKTASSDNNKELLTKACQLLLKQKVLYYRKSIAEVENDIKHISDNMYQNTGPYNW